MAIAGTVRNTGAGGRPYKANFADGSPAGGGRYFASVREAQVAVEVCFGGKILRWEPDLRGALDPAAVEAYVGYTLD